MSNIDLEKTMAELPDLVADALLVWRTATLDKDRLHAQLYITYRSTNPEMTSVEIKARIGDDDRYYQASLSELKAEAEYNRLNERLMAAKKLASLRTAF